MLYICIYPFYFQIKKKNFGKTSPKAVVFHEYNGFEFDLKWIVPIECYVVMSCYVVLYLYKQDFDRYHVYNVTIVKIALMER